MPRPDPLPRATYRFAHRITTRWADNDVYGHVNNAHYYSFFDTTITAFLIASDLIADAGDEPLFYVAASECACFRAFAFPEEIESRLAIAEIGTRSVTWRIGLFAPGEETPRAQGRFVHVCVDRDTERPREWPPAWREVFEMIQTPSV